MLNVAKKMPDYVYKLSNFVKRNYNAMDNDDSVSVNHDSAPMNGTASRNRIGDASDTSSRTKIRCPTCHGIGWVRKEEEGQLVALIPLNDQRLKPRRTIIYVLLAVGLCALIGFLCGFFLYPRDVKLYSKESMALLQPDAVTFGNGTVDFVVTTSVNLVNDNYYSTPVKSIVISVMMNKKELAKTNWVSSNSDKPEALARSTVHLPVNVSFHLDHLNEPQLVERCDNASPWVHNLVMTFVMNVRYTALGHCQEISGSFIQRVVCHPPELPLLSPTGDGGYDDL
ncbi:hypothetical protein EGW08_003434 [Elysia chlorotica]|uniref:Transmembrane protein 106A n=1 Tax=Elysia chlorotica TaxID=188477 RepID=A0A433U4S6_ELYCH|nr:hypothetical protein EGW08_003434 [Elysia chlorotica]